jgi:hypothetical protein
MLPASPAHFDSAAASCSLLKLRRSFPADCLLVFQPTSSLALLPTPSFRGASNWKAPTREFLLACKTQPGLIHLLAIWPACRAGKIHFCCTLSWAIDFELASRQNSIQLHFSRSARHVDRGTVTVTIAFACSVTNSAFAESSDWSKKLTAGKTSMMSMSP